MTGGKRREYTRGSRELRALMKKRGMTSLDVAETLRVDPAQVCRWLNGIYKPRIEVAIRIQHEFGIAVAGWADIVRMRYE